MKPRIYWALVVSAFFLILWRFAGHGWAVTMTTIAVLTIPRRESDKAERWDSKL